MQRQICSLVTAGKLLPQHLEMDIDSCMAVDCGCALLQFLYLLLQKSRTLKSCPDTSTASLKPGNYVLHGGAPATQRTSCVLSTSPDDAVNDRTCAETQIKHDFQIKPLIGKIRSCCS